MTSAPEPAVDATSGPSGATAAADATSGLTQAHQEIAALRQQLIDERERALHALDGQRGAEAVAAQAQAEVRELTYRLHVREAELQQLQEVLDHHEAALQTTVPGGVEPSPLRSSASTVASQLTRHTRSSIAALRHAAKARLESARHD
jgi:chromosome segregation ATPase